MKTKKIFKKGLSLFLALVMMLSIVPMTAITSFAASNTISVTLYEHTSQKEGKYNQYEYIGNKITFNSNGTYSCTKQPQLYENKANATAFETAYLKQSGKYRIEGNYIYFDQVLKSNSSVKISFRGYIHRENGKITKIDSFFFGAPSTGTTGKIVYNNAVSHRTYFKTPINNIDKGSTSSSSSSSSSSTTNRTPSNSTMTEAQFNNTATKPSAAPSNANMSGITYSEVAGTAIKRGITGETYSDGKIAVGKTLNISWSAVSRATEYEVKLDGKVINNNVTSTSYSVPLTSVGVHTIEVAGKNRSGTGPSIKKTCMAMPKVTVDFFDDEGIIIETKQIDWNSVPTEPNNVPQKEHYVFSGWQPSISAVKDDDFFTAKYEKIKYNVRFFAYNSDGETVQVGSTQKVRYLEAAIPPANYLSYIRSGMEFAGWSTDFSCIEGNTDVYLIEKWYNENMKIKILDGATAVRDPDGYTVNCTLQNNYDDKTVGRVIVAIKTAEGKLIYTTESAAFTIKAGQTKAMEIYVPCAEMGTVAEIYAVEKYTTALPISLSKHVVVDQGNAFSNWSTEAPPANALEVQSKTQYRYRTKSTTRSGYSSLAGWTRSGDKILVDTDTSNWSPWNNSSPYTSTDATYYTECTVESQRAYEYWSWYQKGSTENGPFWFNTSNYTNPHYIQVYTEKLVGKTNSDYGHDFAHIDNPLVVGNKSSTLGEIFCIYDRPAPITSNASFLSSFTARNNGYAPLYIGSSVTLKRTVKKQYQYSYYKWSDWSEWSDEKIVNSALENVLKRREIETQTVYRYKANDTTNLENTDGVLRTISGKVDATLAGREADLFIYKYNEASDWTNQYIGQCTIGEDGSYSFTFKLRTEPSLTTGDYTATLGIEGTSAVIDLSSEYEWLKAPLPTHNVTYYDVDGSIISTQTVVDGQNAVAPTVIPEREGYTFVGWSESNINVTEDLIISPVMQINTYTVTFIDWENKKYEVRAFSHGDELTAPEIENIPEGYNASWDAFANDIRTVTENMVVCSVYEKQEFTVNFYDYNKELVSTQTVEYGEAADTPELITPENITFVQWDKDECYYVKNDLDVYPVFYYDTTVADPTANYDTDIYSNNITVTLNCETEGATIYYTVDGSNPAENGIEYTEPISIEKSTALSFVAVKKESNNSQIIKKYYALNKADMTSEWMEYEALPEYVIGHETEYSVQINPNGYKYKDITSTDSVSNAIRLTRLGWTELDSTWSDWTEYSMDYPEFSDKEIEIRSKDGDLVEKTFYNYSHYKYYDADTRTYKYAPSLVANTDGVTETLKVEETLTSFGGIVSGTYSFMYNNEQWFMDSPFTTTEMVDPGYDVYSYRTKIYNLYKWSEWTVTVPSANETREYETGVVFRYTVPKEFIVSINFENSGVADKKNNEQMLVMNGKTVNLDENYFDVEGYTLDGIYTDPQYTNEWNIDSDTVTENVTLYPKYTLNTFSVTFLDYDNSIISTQDVSYLHYANIPEDPIRDGYVFINWECIEGTQSDGVISDVTYIARYIDEDEYTRVSLSRSRISIMTGSSSQIKVTLSSLNAKDSDVIWYSSNPEIATVDEHGNITGVHSGTAMITAIAMDTYESANCIVTVLGTLDTEILPISGSGVTVDPSSKYLLGIKAGNNSIESINGRLQNEGLIYTSPDGNVIFNELTKVMGTGCRIALKDVDELIDEVILVIKGDVNGDGAVDAFDAIMVDLINNQIKDVKNEYAVASDLTDDGEIDSADYAMLRATVMCNAG